MSSVTLWWKPGCATNTRQIALLEAAGCQVEVRDLLTEAWTSALLAEFLGARPVAEWFNPAAPAIKSGEVDPDTFSPDGALARLVADPILIRRPLLDVRGQRCSGFDTEWLGARGVVLPDGPVPQGCSHGEHHHHGDPQRESSRYANPAAYCAPPSGAGLT